MSAGPPRVIRATSATAKGRSPCGADADCYPAASESEWVEKEVLYAIKRKTENQEALPEIIPVIIEGPPPAKPPNSLSFIHFNDKMIYFINSLETRADAAKTIGKEAAGDLSNTN